jgi:hypothetical protein
MANLVEPANISPLNYVNVASRYAKSKVLKYSEKEFLTFETYKKETYTAQKNDMFTVITAGQEYRPDLLSYQVYGVPDFWWRLMEVNGIMDIFDFKAGLTIRLPGRTFA